MPWPSRCCGLSGRTASTTSWFSMVMASPWASSTRRTLPGSRSSNHPFIMRPHSRQILTVEETFGANGWHCELVEGRDVLRAGFEAHHTRVDLIAQAYPQLNALSVVTESP